MDGFIVYVVLWYAVSTSHASLQVERPQSTRDHVSHSVVVDLRVWLHSTIHYFHLKDKPRIPVSGKGLKYDQRGSATLHWKTQDNLILVDTKHYYRQNVK